MDKLVAALIIFAFALACLVYFGLARFGKKSAPSPCDAAAAEPPRQVQITVTAADKRFAWQAPREFRTTAGMATRPVIEVFPQKRRQNVIGFGGALTDAAAIDFELLSKDRLDKVFYDLFSPKEMGFNVMRINIGSSDYAPALRSICPGETIDPVIASLIIDYNKKNGTKIPVPLKPDPQLKTFTMSFDEQHLIPLCKLADEYAGHQIWKKAAAWSPPPWTKSNDSIEGGNLQRTYMPALAKCYAKWVKGWADHGVTINAMTTNNEVDTDQDGNMPACVVSAENEALFVMIFGTELKRQGINTQILLCDHNYNSIPRVESQLETKEVFDNVAGTALHGYAGKASKMTALHEHYPSKDIYWTEGGPDITDPNYGKDWVKWGKIITDVMRNWSRCFIAWNLALDEEGKPNIGPFPCGGVITINKHTKEISYSGQYYALGQFSRFVKPDAVRVDSQGEIADVSHVAFVNPDGSMVAVLTNDSATAHALTIKLGTQTVDVEIEPNSVSTLVF